MMQRRNIRGSELKPNASQHIGMLNAEKCVAYLRGVGVEIDDKTADSWLDAQATHRFLRSEKTVWRRVELWCCRCGEMRGHRETGRGRMRLKREKGTQQKPARCEECGTGWISMHLVFCVCRDGTVKDYRRGVDAVIPLRLDEWAGGL
jgi:hypothetical protein